MADDDRVDHEPADPFAELWGVVGGLSEAVELAISAFSQSADDKVRRS
jgi:hypothetical protein